MKKFSLIFLLVFLSFCASVTDDEEAIAKLPVTAPEQLPVNSGHPEFVGKWLYTAYGEYLSGIDDFDWWKYESLTFDNFNKYQNYYTKKDYGITPYGYPHSYDYEWKIESSQFCEKLWDNQFSTWTCKSYTINATTLTIDGTDYTKQ